MYVYEPARPLGVVVVTDTRMRADAELERHEGRTAGGPRVLERWAEGRQAFGAEWAHVTRVALFDHDADPTRKELQRARTEYLDYLTTLHHATVFVLPTPPAGSGEAAATVGTEVWRPFDAPDALAEMRGTLMRRSVGEVIAGHPLNRRAKQLYSWQQVQFLRWAQHAAVQQARRQPSCYQPALYTTPNGGMLGALDDIIGKAVAVDLEFIPDSDTVMAIGVATDNGEAISIPWHGFEPGGSAGYEPDLRRQCGSESMYTTLVSYLRDVLASDAPKAAHNFVADIPRLEALGFKVNGPLLDTYAAHAIAYPEIRHGLQHACASMFPCRPWKSEWRPKSARGLTRDDIEWWTCEPEGLRRYNALDAYHTQRLARAIAPAVRFDWPYTPCASEHASKGVDE